jgi:hypothetical protein
VKRGKTSSLRKKESLGEYKFRCDHKIYNMLNNEQMSFDFTKVWFSDITDKSDFNGEKTRWR